MNTRQFTLFQLNFFYDQRRWSSQLEWDLFSPPPFFFVALRNSPKKKNKIGVLCPRKPFALHTIGKLKGLYCLSPSIWHLLFYAFDFSIYDVHIAVFNLDYTRSNQETLNNRLLAFCSCWQPLSKLQKDLNNNKKNMFSYLKLNAGIDLRQ